MLWEPTAAARGGGRPDRGPPGPRRRVPPPLDRGACAPVRWGAGGPGRRSAWVPGRLGLSTIISLKLAIMCFDKDKSRTQL